MEIVRYAYYLKIKEKLNINDKKIYNIFKINEIYSTIYEQIF